MKGGPLIGALVGLAAVAALAPTAHAEESAFKGGIFDPPRDAPDFKLDGSNGAPIGVAQFKGKVVVMAFGFTYCPRICPVTLANLSRVFDKLGDKAADVQVIFVTVDPARDTPARMREFLEFFNPRFLGATGTPEQLEAVRREYGITANRAESEDKKLGYEVHHSSSIYVVDREGKLRLLIPFGKPPDDILHDLMLLLAK